MTFRECGSDKGYTWDGLCTLHALVHSPKKTTSQLKSSIGSVCEDMGVRSKRCLLLSARGGMGRPRGAAEETGPASLIFRTNAKHELFWECAGFPLNFHEFLE